MKKTNSIQIFNMKLSPKPYEMIASGKKTIELRLYDEKRSQIREGDVIVFTQAFSGDSVTTKVLALHRFKSFEELYEGLPLLKCGYTVENIKSASYQDMTAYYSLEEQKKYGVVGIELCLISE